MLEIYQISLIKNNQKIKIESVQIRTRLTKEKYLNRYRKQNSIDDDVIIDLAYKERMAKKTEKTKRKTCPQCGRKFISTEDPDKIFCCKACAWGY